MEYLTTVELSERWNITSRRIGVLCAEGRIEGAIKKGKTGNIKKAILKTVSAFGLIMSGAVITAAFGGNVFAETQAEAAASV